MNDQFDQNLNLENGDDENLVLDLDGVSEERPAFEALPPGVYDCTIENTTYGKSSAGNPMITWNFAVIDEQYAGRLFFYHTVLNSEAGLSRLKRLLLRVCSDIPLGGFSPKNFCDEGLALGRACRVKVRVKPYQGVRRNEVTDVLAPGEAGSFLNG